ncbi:class I SAM-dependent DNA methyltransferase [Mariluticola halotolerans]|uniref:class I SAM-dependent DNA methyltransferase n=1 Tax=Mariluticola halotolerans TaxID=2909283 RepID=UPI0026E296C5|nr:DNA methyltransferase [Mariluticola halotolerans]UJQ93353.1 class I SAM-dependent DNA methyltransferase [Mariluticola halotolerans]
MTDLDQLIANASASGGSERANYQLFILGLCEALGLQKPEMAQEHNHHNDYVFERRVDFKHPDGSRTAGFIDCYKRDSFVLEAKQSAKRQKAAENQFDLHGEEAGQRKLGHARRGGAGWDKVMIEARRQAENYARALPVEHGYPPFLIVVDVGHVIEIYADFSGQGKNYAHFPDRQNYRIRMDDLRDANVQARLAAIWSDPHSLDPAKKSAEVTRDIAGRLSIIAKRLEGKHDPRDVAEFLMRCLFTMFAEDVDLLPKGMFADLLGQLADDPKAFVPALETLWKTMDEGGFEPRSMASLKRFNGSLFKTRRALPLAPEDIHELYVAAKMDWQDVEPAIFGTLLERALDPRERSKLGAHYTPRAYVERLVVPTIIEPLRGDWVEVQARLRELHDAGDDDAALKLAKDFHHKLCTTRVLDPACGTGNFLYVSLELLKKLEGEVLTAIEDLGEDQSSLMMDGETVNPRQFHGLELNPRAVPIADLVLWIGFLKWQLKTVGLKDIPEPILHAYGTIQHQDAILAYDAEELVRDDKGAPVTRWDGVTKMAHPITGEDVPDPSAHIELYTYKNPRSAPWPEVEFIVGNPPFIGGKDLRAELGDGYAEAVWKARPNVPGGADFVMQFWDEAATRLTRKATKSNPNPLRRFGFITTNSITQTFSRRVIEKHMAGKTPLSLIFAVPDHPWLKASDKAAVRIAMTVAVKGAREGVLAEVVDENGLNTDAPLVSLETKEGKLRANLSVGADLSLLKPLHGNSSLAHMGVKLHGMGFIVKSADEFPETERELFKRFVNGRDLAQSSRNVLAIDLFGLSRKEAATKAPYAFQYIRDRVKPEREAQANKSPTADAVSYAENWWVWGKPRGEWRTLTNPLPRFIATARTARHRVFQYLSKDVVIESKVVGIGVDDPSVLAVVSSRPHLAFSENTGGWLGVGNDATYNHSDCFTPFPFPDLAENAETLSRLTDLGERLDNFRKERLAAHEFLTMTGLYNVLERVRELEWGAGPGRAVLAERGETIDPLTDKERAIYDAGLVGVLKDIHDEIDQLVFAAYGWDDLAPRLVGMPGATTPSGYKTEDQQAAEEDLLTRLVALNQTRAAEEARGQVRWLRPDYQIPKLGHKVARPDGVQAEADLTIITKADKPKWPTDGLDQIRVVVDVLAQAPAPVLPDAIAAAFDGRNTPKRKTRVEQVLNTLVATGSARTGEMDGQTRYFVPR